MEEAQEARELHQTIAIIPSIMAPVFQSRCSPRIITPLYLWFFVMLVAVTQSVGRSTVAPCADEDNSRNFVHSKSSSTTSSISHPDPLPTTVSQLTPKNDLAATGETQVRQQVVRASNDATRQLHAAITEKEPEEEGILNDDSNKFFGIPGTTQTMNGYDTALGANPICWMGKAASSADQVSQATAGSVATTAFPNPLVEDFTLLGETKLLTSCPTGNYLRVQQPIESKEGTRLRTLRYYNYSLELSIDVESLQGDVLVSDDNGAAIGLQVVLCTLGKSGFCSPFVHEQANARDEYFGINVKRVKGDLHGGTHIHSPWVFFDMGNATRLFKVNVTIPMIVNEPDDYYVIGTAQLYTGNVSTTSTATLIGSTTNPPAAAFRYDMANALLSDGIRIVRYQAPPKILRVSTATHVFGVISSTFAALIILFYIFQTLRWRKEQVMRLSQADFLIAFLVAALISSLSVFLLQHKTDTYCRLYSPMILIPIQFMYAIAVGRLWRIHSVISPLLMEQLSGGRTTWTQSFIEILTKISLVFHRNVSSRSNTQGLRRQVSNTQLLSIVIIFTLPQVIMQLLAGILQPQELQIDFNPDESIGREHCASSTGRGLFEMCFLVLFMLIGILLLMAHSSNKLPSLLNESQVIYDSTFLSVILLMMGVAIKLVTQGPTTSPDVEYLAWLTVILSITLNCTYRIVHPKLQKVWSGEQVIVSKLVSDHHRVEREKRKSHLGMTNVSGLNFEPTSKVMTNSSMSPFDLSDSRLSNEQSMQLESVFGDDETVVAQGRKLSESQTSGNATPEDYDEEAAGGSHSDATGNDQQVQTKKKSSGKRNRQKKRGKIAVTVDEAPDRGLVLRMMNLQEQLTEINKKIISGQAVTPSDWGNVTKMNAKLEDIFSNHVEFEFEIPPSDQSLPLVNTPKQGIDTTKTPTESESGKSMSLFGSLLSKMQLVSARTGNSPTRIEVIKEESEEFRNESENPE